MYRHQFRTASRNLKVGLVALNALVVAAGSAVAGLNEISAAATKAESAEGPLSPYSWRSDVYQAPDFERFFPEDPKGAETLATLWNEVRKERDRQEANPNGAGQVKWWKLKGSHPDDELLSNIVTIAWESGAEQRKEMLAALAPYHASREADVVEKARGVERMFKGELDAWEWAVEPARRRASRIYGARLPEFREALRSGSSRTRIETIERLLEERVDLILDDSFLAPLQACAESPQEDVRQAVVNVVDSPGFSKLRDHPKAVALVLKLLNFESPWIQGCLFRSLLQRKEGGPEAVVRALVGIVLDGKNQDDQGVLPEGLGEDHDMVKTILDEHLRGSDALRAGAARLLYRDLTGSDPPDDVKPAGPYERPFTDLYVFLGRSYPNFRMKGIDWAGVGRELLPRASTAKDERKFGLLVEELVARLEDTHAIVVPGSAQPPAPDLPMWDPGLACLMDDRGRPVVYHVDPGSPAARAGIAPGMAVVSVDGTKADEALERWMKRQKTYVGSSSERSLQAQAAWGFVRKDRKGATTTLDLEKPDGSTKSAEVAADLGPRYLPRLPVPKAGIADSAHVSWTKLDGDLRYIYVRRIRQGLEASLDKALRDLGDIKGLVPDLRGNSGGGFDSSTAFVNFDVSPAAMTDRPKNTGPIALLIDERTASAGEGWASWFLAQKRARFFGSTSAGASSRKVTYKLTNGLYQVIVPVKAYTGFLNRPIERRGLEPDVAVRCAANDLARGKDTVLETAAKWLREGGK
jgi:C-terminal processing protease CtpA/Prc